MHVLVETKELKQLCEEGEGLDSRANAEPAEGPTFNPQHPQFKIISGR